MTSDVRPANASRHRRRRSGRIALLALILLGGAVSAVVIGFVLFANGVSTARPPADAHADAIVALTGGSNRIEDAAKLLGAGSADRMLISGVNESTTREALAAHYGPLGRLFRCCIDIGYEALDTKGNASEAAHWARQRGFRSIIVVTSAYHMPRTLTELRRALPEVELVPYPVQSDVNLSSWPRDKAILKLLVLEYGKFLLARIS